MELEPVCLREKSGEKLIKRLESAFFYILGLLFLLALWQLGALAAGSRLILPSPYETAFTLAKLVASKRFWLSLAATTGRLLLGLAISAPLGIALGLLTGLERRLAAFFAPAVSLIASTPVMAVILIAYLSLGAEKTPVFTVCLMVFPVMTRAAKTGVESLDSSLTELFQVYKTTFFTKLRFFYLPSLAPFLASALASGLSLSWKVVVAAEVLVQPALALGAGMQNAKSRLETPELFAWTLSCLCAAALSQGVLTLVLRKKRSRRSRV